MSITIIALWLGHEQIATTNTLLDGFDMIISFFSGTQKKTMAATSRVMPTRTLHKATVITPRSA